MYFVIALRPVVVPNGRVFVTEGDDIQLQLPNGDEVTLRVDNGFIELTDKDGLLWGRQYEERQ